MLSSKYQLSGARPRTLTRRRSLFGRARSLAAALFSRRRRRSVAYDRGARLIYRLWQSRVLTPTIRRRLEVRVNCLCSRPDRPAAKPRGALAFAVPVREATARPVQNYGRGSLRNAAAPLRLGLGFELHSVQRSKQQFAAVRGHRVPIVPGTAGQHLRRAPGVTALGPFKQVKGSVASNQLHQLPEKGQRTTAKPPESGQAFASLERWHKRTLIVHHRISNASSGPAPNSALASADQHAIQAKKTQFTNISRAIGRRPVHPLVSPKALPRTVTNQMIIRATQKKTKTPQVVEQGRSAMTTPSSSSRWLRETRIASSSEVRQTRLTAVSSLTRHEQFQRIRWRQSYTASRLVRSSSPEIPHAATSRPALRRALPIDLALALTPSVGRTHAARCMLSRKGHISQVSLDIMSTHRAQSKLSLDVAPVAEPVTLVMSPQHGPTGRAVRPVWQGSSAVSKSVHPEAMGFAKLETGSSIGQLRRQTPLRATRSVHAPATRSGPPTKELSSAMPSRRVNDQPTLWHQAAQIFSSPHIHRSPSQLDFAAPQPPLPVLTPRLRQTTDTSSLSLVSTLRRVAAISSVPDAGSIPGTGQHPFTQPTSAPPSLTHLRAAPAVGRPRSGSAAADGSETIDAPRNTARSVLSVDVSEQQRAADRAQPMVSPQQLQTISQRVYEIIVDRVRREKERNGR